MNSSGKTNIQGYVEEEVANAVKSAARNSGVKVSSWVAKAVIEKLSIEGLYNTENSQLQGRAKFEAVVEQTIESGISWEQVTEHLKEIFKQEVKA